MTHARLRTAPSPARPPARWIGLALPLLLTLGACGGQAAGAEAGEEADEPKVGVRKAEATRVVTAPVERREMVRYLETTTRIESENEITVLPEVTGIVTAVLAEEGDHVNEGQVLCELERIDQELDLRDAEVALQEALDGERQPELDRAEAEARVKSSLLSWEQARRDHERDQRLFERTEVASPVSRQTLEASKLAMDTAEGEHEQAKIARDKVDLAAQTAATAVERARVGLDRAKAALQKRTIVAPFAGQIATRSVRPGQSVGQADAVFVLTDVSRLRAVFFRAQEELGLFQGRSGDYDNGGGLTFLATTEALPGAEFTGRVVRVSPTIDRESAQFRVTGEFDEPAPGTPPLLPGMLVRLSIATDRHADALVVPKRAVRREGDEVYLLRVTGDSRVERIAITEGYEDGDLVEVVPAEPGSLAVEDRVVSIGSRELEDGNRVEVEGEDSAPTAEAGPDPEAPAEPEAEN